MDNVIQFRPRPNPRREAEQMAEQFGQVMVNAMCWPWLAWANQFDAGEADLYAKGLAIDTAPSEVLHTSDYVAPDKDSA